VITKSEFGPDALAKAERTLQRAKIAMTGNDLTAIVSAAESVESTLALFRGVLARLGGGAPA
jgi:hypothetical protein